MASSVVDRVMCWFVTRAPGRYCDDACAIAHERELYVEGHSVMTGENKA